MGLTRSFIRVMKPGVWLPFFGRFLPVRHRYVLTRDNRLRLRYSLPVVSSIIILSSFGISTQTLRSGHFSVTTEPVSFRVAGMDDFYGPETSLYIMQRRLARYAPSDSDSLSQDDHAKLASFASAPEALPQPREETLVIGKGDTLSGVLQNAGISAGDAFSALKAMESYFDPRQIRPGQEIQVRFDPAESGGYDFAEMRFDIDALKSLSLVRTQEQGFETALHEKDVEKKIYAKNAEIEVSLYGSAQKAGIPASVVAEAIRIYSWDVDFQRDIRHGDKVEVMYEQYETEEGLKVKSGDIVYARLQINGKDIPVYRYESKDGDVDYYTADGASVRKALLTTPVDGARVSSGFGMRKHPVLGYSKMHKGMDFAAPRGTPIYAAGDGVVQRANRFSSFGNYILIRHNNSIETAYAHLNGFAKGIVAGKRVKQGQVIGYVGTTGRSTGPHLHYEVHKNKVAVNPKSVDLPMGTTLKGTELANFQKKIKEIDRQYASLKGQTRVASRQDAEEDSIKTALR